MDTVTVSVTIEKRLASAMLALAVCSLLAMGAVPMQVEAREIQDVSRTHDSGVPDAAATPPSWSSGGPYGGYITCLTLDPSDPDVIYAGTESGLYKTTDGGASWTESGLATMAVRVVEVAPGDSDVVYAGTDQGVYRSADGGVTWAQRGLASDRVHALAVHPDDADLVFAGTMVWPHLVEEGKVVGVFKSSDGGQSWDAKHTEAIEGVEALLFDTNDPSTIYAAVRNASDWTAGFRKSTDGGDTWTGTKVGPYSPWDEVVALGMTPAGHSPATLYASSPVGEDVYASTDQGETWTNTDVPGLYQAAAIKVDPKSPGTVYVAAESFFSSEGGGRFYRSLNGGESWEVKASGLSGTSASGLVVDPVDGDLCVGLEEGGVFRSTDRADHWAVSNEGVINTSINGLAAHPSSPGTAFAAVKGFPFAKTADGGGSWTYPPDGPTDLGAVAVNPSDPSVLWAGHDFRYGWTFHVYKSTDGGASWESINYLRTSDGTTTGVTDILVSSADTQCVLVGTSYEIYNGISGIGLLARTTTGGEGWLQIGGATTALAADPNTPGLVYQGKSRTGQLFAISDACGSANSQEITPEAGIGDVRDIEVGSQSEVYVAASDGLWRREGTSWTTLSGLPGEDVMALAIDQAPNPDLLYISLKDEGVYASADGGDTWNDWNGDLPDLEVTELAIGDASPSTLYAGTRYGGVWTTGIESATDSFVYLPLVVR